MSESDTLKTPLRITSERANGIEDQDGNIVAVCRTPKHAAAFVEVVNGIRQMREALRPFAALWISPEDAPAEMYCIEHSAIRRARAARGDGHE